MASGQSGTLDRILNIFVSAAAVPVLLGALFKITHAPGADTWLKVGLYTESAIFLCYALQYVFAPPKEGPIVVTSPAPEHSPMPRPLDPDVMKKLNESFSKLSVTAAGLSDLSEVVKSTSDFGAKTKEASVAIGSMTASFANTAATMSSFNKASESAQGFHEQVQVLTKNLGSLNTIYELELKESNNHLKALNGFYGKMAEASATMMSSVDDANKAKVQISLLAGNLGKLNAVYGNMLSAMQSK